MKKYRVSIALSVALLIMTPWFIKICNQTRPKPGVGGEALIWLFPPLIHALFQMMKEIMEVYKNESR